MEKTYHNRSLSLFSQEEKYISEFFPFEFWFEAKSLFKIDLPTKESLSENSVFFGARYIKNADRHFVWFVIKNKR
jgi:hypothetical protein